jgi:hypothetical protein
MWRARAARFSVILSLLVAISSWPGVGVKGGAATAAVAAGAVATGCTGLYDSCTIVAKTGQVDATDGVPVTIDSLGPSVSINANGQVAFTAHGKTTDIGESVYGVMVGDGTADPRLAPLTWKLQPYNTVQINNRGQVVSDYGDANYSAIEIWNTLPGAIETTIATGSSFPPGFSYTPTPWACQVSNFVYLPWRDCFAEVATPRINDTGGVSFVAFEHPTNSNAVLGPTVLATLRYAAPSPSPNFNDYNLSGPLSIPLRPAMANHPV